MAGELGGEHAGVSHGFQQAQIGLP
jgi:hypothetical protein